MAGAYRSLHVATRGTCCDCTGGPYRWQRVAQRMGFPLPCAWRFDFSCTALCAQVWMASLELHTPQSGTPLGSVHAGRLLCAAPMCMHGAHEHCSQRRIIWRISCWHTYLTCLGAWCIIPSACCASQLTSSVNLPGCSLNMHSACRADRHCRCASLCTAFH